ncbi:unnamed protein product [Fusarium equiseti]|uniref:Uncharacterized protein n=1 Tax=Fusarium equiseti TaxID=61235 RepID=A0A8J2IGR6_FUSEQ|nr:unnamed protein product [Fusarium equiseti]
MSSKPTRGWDATSHEDLLLAILEEIKPSRAILTSVADKMREKGYSYSFDAINQHVQKLRKNRDTSAIQNSSAEPTTPRKPRGASASGTKTPAKRTPKRKAPKSADIADDEDDLEDMKLQLKMETADEDILSPKSLKRAKVEHDDEDELNSGEA